MDVKLHSDVHDQYIRWRRSLADTRSERSRLARQFWQEFQEGIVGADGPPSGAIKYLDKESGNTYWTCPFPPRYLAIVQFREKHTGFLKLKTIKEAIVIELNFSPGLPHRADEETPLHQL